MSEHGDSSPDERDEKDGAVSVSNPFAERDDPVDERPPLNLSKRRAAVLGTGFGVVMVALLIVCFLLSVALASCNGN